MNISSLIGKINARITGKLKVSYYRKKCKHIGQEVKIGKNVQIIYPKNLEIYDNSAICDEVKIIGGNGVKIGKNVVIQERCIIQGAGYPQSKIEIGENTNISKCSYLHGGGGIFIGKDVLIGPHCVINSTQHIFEDISTNIREQGTELKRIVIKDNVWIGANATIILGITVGEGSIIGAGAVVTRDIPPFAIATGVPAKVIKYRK